MNWISNWFVIICFTPDKQQICHTVKTLRLHSLSPITLLLNQSCEFSVMMKGFVSLVELDNAEHVVSVDAASPWPGQFEVRPRAEAQSQRETLTSHHYNFSQQKKHSAKTVEHKQFNAEDLDVAQKWNELLFCTMMSHVKLETSLSQSGLTKYLKINLWHGTNYSKSLSAV